MRAAAVVVTWEGGEATLRCVDSLLAQDHPPTEVVVVDNASGAEERASLRARLGDRPGVRLLLLDDNRQFAGGLNAGAEVAFAAGADAALLLNNDTLLAPDALGRLCSALDAAPGAGIAGPLVRDVSNRDHILSAGERHDPALLCLPRTLLRYRGPTDAPYPVSGVMGCALLVRRACFEAVGGFSREIEVYYEDVDFCLGARSKGFGALVEPRAAVYHDGLRGFVGGLTPWAAYLKARNPWLVIRRHGGPLARLAFAAAYAPMLLASAALWTLRGRIDVARALARGAWAGARTLGGTPPAPAGAPRKPA